MIYPEDGELLNNKEEWSSDTCDNMDEAWKHNRVKEPSGRWPRVIRFRLHEMFKIGNPWRQKVNSWLSAAERDGEG